MSMYDYLCEGCGLELVDTRFARIGEHHPSERCPDCGAVLLRGVCNVNLGPVMQEHFNVAVGKPISSDKQFRNELKRKSDEMSARTGADHNFVPVDMSDKTALGITDEGLDAAAKVRQDSGAQPSKRRYIT